MKKILIDVRRKLNSGIGRVTQWLVENISSNDELDIFYLVTEITKQQYNINDKIIEVEFNVFSLDDFYTIPKIIAQNEFDIFLSPQINNSPFNIVKNITIIHDLWFLKNTDTLPTLNDINNRFNLQDKYLVTNFSNWLNENRSKNILTDYGYELWSNIKKQDNTVANFMWSLQSANSYFCDHLVFVHKDVKKDYNQIFRRNYNQSIIYNGFNTKFKNVKKKEKKHFLCLAKLEKRKNILKLIEGYKIYLQDTKLFYGLRIAGDPGYNEYASIIIEEINNLKKCGYDVEFIPSANDKQLMQLFSESVGLFFPSMYESFGLPPLEAMLAEVPVVASKVGMMNSEIGKHATILNQQEPNEIAYHMIGLENNYQKYESKIKIAKATVLKELNNDIILQKWKHLLLNI